MTRGTAGHARGAARLADGQRCRPSERLAPPRNEVRGRRVFHLDDAERGRALGRGRGHDRGALAAVVARWTRVEFMTRMGLFARQGQDQMLPILASTKFDYKMPSPTPRRRWWARGW